MSARRRIPKLCRHNASGLAVVRLDGRDHYLGPYGGAAAESSYHRLIAEWLAAGGVDTVIDGRGCQTVAELADAYLRHALGYYRKSGRPTAEIHHVRSVLRVLVGLYADLPVDAFDVLELKACRQAMIDSGNARTTINQSVSRIKRVFRWAGENRLIDPLIHARLLCVKGIDPGRGGRETAPRAPVTWADVQAAGPHVGRQVWTMINLQWLTGMRSQNVVEMRTIDIDTAGDVWFYTPPSDKMHHRRKSRQRLTIAMGPRAQNLLRPWLRADLEAHLFQPHEAVAEQAAARRLARKTPLWPSHIRRPSCRRPRHPPGCSYTPASYRRAIVRACRAAGVRPWHPHQLRHAFATRTGDAFDGHLDKVAAALGHASVDVTLLYAHLNRAKAAEVARRIG